MGAGRTRRVAHRRIERQHLVFLRFVCEELFSSSDFVWILGGHVVGLGPVLCEVIELPGDVVEGSWLTRPGDDPRAADHLGAGDPAVVIDSVVAHHFEVLRLVARGALALGLIEGVGEAHAFDGLCLMPSTDSGAADAGRLREWSAPRR